VKKEVEKEDTITIVSLAMEGEVGARN